MSASRVWILLQLRHPRVLGVGSSPRRLPAEFEPSSPTDLIATMASKGSRRRVEPSMSASRVWILLQLWHPRVLGVGSGPRCLPAEFEPSSPADLIATMASKGSRRRIEPSMSASRV